ncbi:predicted protein [Nematostella vectensis]|uniref:Uncharacterized protein n=1 Tax=Nematostella vectensis TaxID=45351 RepID=A7T249_NEMVE|nr:predicted protein [Nematostella vectensis]|eukprot:XP_001622065.1 hypothetical protein NEMVEDRAFT_v1g221204 [Nematostella vectensis]
MPKYKVDAYFEDQTENINIVLWEDAINKVNVGKTYHFKNLRVRIFDDAKFLNTNEFTIIELIEDMPGVNFNTPKIQFFLKMQRFSSLQHLMMAWDVNHSNDSLNEIDIANLRKKLFDSGLMKMIVDKANQANHPLRSPKSIQPPGKTFAVVACFCMLLQMRTERHTRGRGQRKSAPPTTAVVASSTLHKLIEASITKTVPTILANMLINGGFVAQPTFLPHAKIPTDTEGSITRPGTRGDRFFGTEEEIELSEGLLGLRKIAFTEPLSKERWKDLSERIQPLRPNMEAGMKQKTKKVLASPHTETRELKHRAFWRRRRQPEDSTHLFTMAKDPPADKNIRRQSRPEDEPDDLNLDSEHEEQSKMAAMPPEDEISPHSITPTDVKSLTEDIYCLTKRLNNDVQPSMKAKEGKRNGDSRSEIPAKKAKSGKKLHEPSSSRSSSDESSSDEEDTRESLLKKCSAAPSDDEDDFVKQLAKEYESEDLIGDDLQNKQLARLLEKMLRNRLPDKRLKEKLDKQDRPENCPAAKATRVNPGIWRKLREHTKKRDLQFYKLQHALVKGIMPLTRLTDMCMSAKGSLDAASVQQIKQFGLEALSLITHANYELNMQRRLLMKPDIGREYAALCSPQVPFTDMLFGDDLQKHLKDIGDVNKIGAKLQSKKGPQSFRSSQVNNHRRSSKNWNSQNYKSWKRGEPTQKSSIQGKRPSQ